MSTLLASGSVSSDLWDLLRFDSSRELLVPAAKLGLAVCLGGVIGVTRERVREAAGLRTHAIVAVSAAAIVGGLVGEEFSADSQTRVIQGVLQGVGFLGAGTIIQRGGERGGVRGLTTAASIWLVAVIGSLCGMGALVHAVTTTVLAWVVLVPLKRIESALQRSSPRASKGTRAAKAAGTATPGPGPTPGPPDA